MAQSRRDNLGEKPFEPAVPLLVGRIAIQFRQRLKPGPSTCRREIGERGREWIDASQIAKCLGAGDSLDTAGAQRRAAEVFHERRGFGKRRAGRVPLQQHELDVVLPATFAGTKRPRKLVDRPRVGRQEPLHQRLRARLKVVRRPIRAVDMHGDRIDVRLRKHL